MMDEQQALALSHLYVEARIAAAEQEWLLRAVGTRRTYFSACAAWAGTILVRIGRRLEASGGAAHTAPSLEMRRAA
ncbi:MAG: hypothetical protein LC793_03065 [Thermomicrobia bacterium]|nr:hypothetical protein [Thermomicrobia bacterium]MCA1723454.1 hypothetical protein [Thermomicrobia bacterium]